MKFEFNSRAMIAMGAGLILWAGVGWWYGIDWISCVACASVGACSLVVGIVLNPYDVEIGGGA